MLNGAQKHISAVSLGEQNLLRSFSIVPNPVEDQFTLVMDLRNEITAEIVIYSTTGQEVSNIATQTYASGEQIIEGSVEELPAGVYYVTVRTDNHSVTEKLIVQ